MKNFKGQTFSFIGRPGSGKSTQSDLLHKYLDSQGYEALIHFYVGQLFRNFAEDDTVMGRWIKKVLAKGTLPPDWIALTLWVNELKGRLVDNDQIVVIDGTPRRLIEAKALDELLIAINRPVAIPIYLDVSEAESAIRSEKRGLHNSSRANDGNRELNDTRLAWFKTNVEPVLEYWQDRLIYINGEGSIEDVWRRIETALKAL